MTQFNEGWWNCFVSFANALMLFRRGFANNDSYMLEVLKDAGIRRDEIVEYLAGNSYVPDNVRLWLENYADSL